MAAQGYAERQSTRSQGWKGTPGLNQRLLGLREDRKGVLSVIAEVKLRCAHLRFTNQETPRQSTLPYFNLAGLRPVRLTSKLYRFMFNCTGLTLVL